MPVRVISIFYRNYIENILELTNHEKAENNSA